MENMLKRFLILFFEMNMMNLFDGIMYIRRKEKLENKLRKTLGIYLRVF
jgi:hypothetical protein